MNTSDKTPQGFIPEQWATAERFVEEVEAPEQTPLEIAREVWPLDWMCDPPDTTTLRAHHPFTGKFIWCYFMNGNWYVDLLVERLGPDLRVLLEEARRETMVKLDAAYLACQPKTSTHLSLDLHTDREKGAIWALHGLRQPVRFGPPSAVNAEVKLPELAELGRDDVEAVREVILRALCALGAPRLTILSAEATASE